MIARSVIKFPRSHTLIGQGILSAGTVTNVQFFRESCYAIREGQQKSTLVTRADATRTTVKSGRHKACARAVICEAARAGPEFSKNLDLILEPVTHYGVHHTKLLDWYKELEAKAKKIMLPCSRNGTYYERRQSPTTVILLGAVASYPGAPEDADERYLVWKKLVIEWATTHYGTHLISIIEHVDEPSGHLHILVADDGHGVKRLTAEDAGIKQAKAQELRGKAFGAVVDAARSRLQDAFYAAVSAPLGIARMSASPKPRQSYSRAKAAQLKAIGAKLENDKLIIELNKKAHAAQKRKDQTAADDAARENMLGMIANKARAQDLEVEARRFQKAKTDALAEIETMHARMVSDAAAEVQVIKEKAKASDAQYREVVEFSRRMQDAYENLLENFVPKDRLNEARKSILCAFQAKT